MMIMFHALINEERKEELSKSVMTKKFQQAGFHLYLIFGKKESISSNSTAEAAEATECWVCTST